MTFIRHVHIRVLQEFQAYWNFPKRLAAIAFSTFIYLAVFIYVIFNHDHVSTLYICSLSFRSAFFIGDLFLVSSIFWTFLSEMIRNRDSKIQKFLIKNGISKSAFFAAIFIKNLLVITPVSYFLLLSFKRIKRS